jgi:pimeloyl-ACP methyl ester carboxylesterase
MSRTATAATVASLFPESGLLPYSEDDPSTLPPSKMAKIADPYKGMSIDEIEDEGPGDVFTLARTVRAAARRALGPVDEGLDGEFSGPLNGEDTADGAKEMEERVNLVEMGQTDLGNKRPPVRGLARRETFSSTLLHGESTPVDMTGFQWWPLFAHMQLRKLARVRTGYRVNPSKNGPFIFMIVVFGWLFGFFVVTDTYSELDLATELGFTDWAWALFGLVLVPGMFVIRFQVPLLLEICWIWATTAFLIALVFATRYAVVYGDAHKTGGICTVQSGGGPNSQACLSLEENAYNVYLTGRTATVCVFGSLIGLTLITFLVRNHVFPWLTRRGGRTENGGWMRTLYSVQIGEQSGGHFTLTYRLPFPLSLKRFRHTFRYRGGVAAGHAEGFGRVTDSSSTGEILEGWFSNGVPGAPFRSTERGRFNSFEGLRVGIVGATGTDWKKTGTHGEPRIGWGVAETECSVAGRFFRDLPRRSVVLQRVATGRPDYLEQVVLPCLATGIPGILKYRHEREAVVYVHGLKQSLASATTKVAQLAGLAALPGSRFALWCFDWPAGGPFSFNRTRRTSGSAETEARFGEFLKALVVSGCRKVHLIGHSMGSRVATNLARYNGAGFDGIFRPRSLPGSVPSAYDSDDEEDGTALASLSSVILINPEILLEDFLLNRFPGLHGYTSSITIYADRNDGALYTAESVGKGLTLGRNPSLVVVKDAKEKVRAVDVDVIDNTHLEANIGTVRHSYFALNRWEVFAFVRSSDLE